MRKTELATRIFLTVIVAVAIVAIILQIMNKKTDALETTYEIITFLAALTCVITAVLQGVANAHTTHELTKIAREIRELVDTVERDEAQDRALKREIKKDLEIDQQELEKIVEQK